MASGGEDELDISVVSDASHETSDGGGLYESLRSLSLYDENRDGKWLDHWPDRPAHPWKYEKPDPDLKMKDTVDISASYPLQSTEWIKETRSRMRKHIDLSKVFSKLPKFVLCEMQGGINSGRQEVEELVKGHLGIGAKTLKRFTESDSQGERDFAFSKLQPHTREICDKFQRNDSSNDKPSFPNDRHFKATSLFPRNPPYLIRFLYIDCEYMLNASVPISLLSWFDIPNLISRDSDELINDPIGAMQRIQKIAYANKEKRWVFTPSFRRAQIALLTWPEDDIVNEENTIRILVVRPSEFEEYVTECGHTFPVIRLPQDEIGAGYPRCWIQKIALRLKLQFIWMIDDSVECFYEYHPYEEPPYRQDKNGKWRCNYRDYRRRRFGLVFKRIEDFVKEADDNEKPIAAISPRRWNAKCKPKQPFVCKPPQGAVFLNLRALSEKYVYYRPELKFLEDMIFGYECEQKGLKVFMDNRVHIKDHNWKHTGARSPSVKAILSK